MDGIDEQQASSIGAQRSIIRQSLDEIANDVGMAMRDASLDFFLGLAVQNSGEALLTMVTPGDPSDEDWSHATGIVSKKLGGMRLRSRPLACAEANATMNAVDITAD